MSSLIVLSFNTVLIIIEYDKVDIGNDGSKLVKSWKTLMAWKIAKAIGLEKLSFFTFNTKLVFTKIIWNS